MFRRYISSRGVPAPAFLTNGMRARSHNSFLCNVAGCSLLSIPAWKTTIPLRRCTTAAGRRVFQHRGRSLSEKDRKETLTPTSIVPIRSTSLSDTPYKDSIGESIAFFPRDDELSCLVRKVVANPPTLNRFDLIRRSWCAKILR